MSRPSVKTYDNMTEADFLSSHEDMIKKLQDPSFASIKRSQVKSGTPMHLVVRDNLQALEREMTNRGINFSAASSRILPDPDLAVGGLANVGTQVQALPKTMPNTSATVESPGSKISAQINKPAIAAPKAVISASEDTAKQVVAQAAASRGAPMRANPAGAKQLANQMSDAVSKGLKNSKNLKMLGVASLIGLAGYAANRAGGNRTQQDNIDRRLQMQRDGIINNRGGY